MIKNKKEAKALMKNDFKRRFFLNKEEVDLYFHLLNVTKKKPHNISKDITYKKSLILESKGLVTIKDYGDRAHIYAKKTL